MKLTATFIHTDETKGAVIYQETDANGEIIDGLADVVVGRLYIRKSRTGKSPPGNIKITIEKAG